jgi:hypothetical protein
MSRNKEQEEALVRDFQTHWTELEKDYRRKGYSSNQIEVLKVVEGRLFRMADRIQAKFKNLEGRIDNDL